MLQLLLLLLLDENMTMPFEWTGSKLGRRSMGAFGELEASGEIQCLYRQ